LPLFEDEHEDWFENNMDWVDVFNVATLVSTSYNYQEAWMDGEVEVL